MSAEAAAEKRSLKEDLSALFQSPRELWIIYFAKFLEMLATFSLLYTVTLWLSRDLGLSDVEAGSWVGVYSMALSVITFFIGFFADSWGFRGTLIVAFGASMFARGTMAFAQSRWLGIAGLMLLTIGTAGGAPVMNTAIRRYTKAQTRAFAFSLYYVTFNVSAAVAGVLIDVSKAIVPTPRMMDVPLLGALQMSQYRLTYVVGLACAVVSFIISLSLRKGIDLERDPDGFAPGKQAASVFLGFMFFVAGMVVVQLSGTLFGVQVASRTLWIAAGVCAVASAVAVFALHAKGFFVDTTAKAEKTEAEAEAPVEEAEKTSNPLKVAFGVMREKAFWRFMLFVGLLVFVKLIFSHSHFTFPKYALREMGEKFPLGAFQAINPILIIILVPVATALTRHRSAFNVIVLGSIVSALSPFVLVLGPGYLTILGMIVLLSIGECLWSPRLYEYTAMIAPRGREASYMGMSSLPMFFAKMAVGPMSGFLLARYCPPEGARQSWMMWLIIGLTTLAGPLLILALRRVIEGRGKAAAEEPAVEAAAAE